MHPSFGGQCEKAAHLRVSHVPLGAGDSALHSGDGLKQACTGAGEMLMLGSEVYSKVEIEIGKIILNRKSNILYNY